VAAFGRRLPFGELVVSSIANDAKHWRERAEEARVHAELISNPEAKRTMLDIAVGYERLARLAEERTASTRPDLTARSSEHEVPSEQ
jgi:hypothetical protein